MGGFRQLDHIDLWPHLSRNSQCSTLSCIICPSSHFWKRPTTRVLELLLLRRLRILERAATKNTGLFVVHCKARDDGCVCAGRFHCRWMCREGTRCVKGICASGEWVFDPLFPSHFRFIWNNTLQGRGEGWRERFLVSALYPCDLAGHARHAHSQGVWIAGQSDQAWARVQGAGQATCRFIGKTCPDCPLTTLNTLTLRTQPLPPPRQVSASRTRA